MTIRKIAILVATAGLVVAIAAAYPRKPPLTPAGQPALLTLGPASFSEFEAAFAAHLEQPRLVLLLTPT